jgi:ASC-1-like (ASCH) protein
MKKHILKIMPVFFEAVADGSKTFEIRINDRNYKEGDAIELHHPNGRNIIKASIGFLTDYGQIDNVVVFSLLNIEKVL